MSPIEGLVRIQVERAERHEIEAQGTVRQATQLPATMRIVNLSRSGCLFRSVDPIAPGTTISIGIPGIGPMPAIVMRNGADGIGCAFTTPLTQAMLDGALAARGSDDDRASETIRRLRRTSEAAAPARASFWDRMRARPVAA